MKSAFFPTTAKALVPVCAALAMLSPGAQAESTYGYSAAGAAGPTARARVDLKIQVPTLILLRVGTAGSQIDEITIAATPSGAGLPGTLSNGNNQAITWDGTAPIMSASAPAGIPAFAWTNYAGGGSLSRSVPTFTNGGPASADLLVASTGTLSHPGTNLATGFTASTFPANTLATGTWTYSLAAGALSTLTAGTHSATVTYTATAL